MPFASPAFAPCLSSCSKRMLPFAPPQVGHDVTDAANVPESCHASRTRIGPQFSSRMKARIASRQRSSSARYAAASAAARPQ